MEKNHTKAALGSVGGERAITARQSEVLDLVAAGQGNKEIAHRMGISKAAVKKHLESLRRRYKASNRVQVVRAALDRGDLHLRSKN